MSVKVILDTDIGTDIDDAIALTYLLHNPDCNLLGITTVTGEARKRAMIASSLCRHAGKDIPIYPGFEKPMRIEQRQRLAIQGRSLHKWPHEKNFPEGEAVSFLRKTIRANPGEVVLLTIGPLTNIGSLYELDPEIPSLLKAHILMGGYYDFKFKGRGHLEWNIRGDFNASEIVFNAAVPVIKAIGLDVTWRVVLSADEFKEKFSAPEFLPLQDYAHHWYREFTHEITFHDPLAAAVIFNDGIVKFERGDVVVITKGKRKKGFTSFKRNNDGRHLVATEVRKEKFFNEYFSVFK